MNSMLEAMERQVPGEAHRCTPGGLSAMFSAAAISTDLRFRVSDLSKREQHTGNFRPFYQVPERVPYRIYFDLDSPRFL